MTNQKLLRIAAMLLLFGSLLLYVGEYFHSQVGPGILPNDHRVEFRAYAAAGDWTVIHLGLLIATTVFVAGLLVLFLALNSSDTTSRVIGIMGVVSAGVTIALYAVDAAVDGIALKQAAVAWISAPPAEQAARFASVEAIRWLEWGTKSLGAFMYGLTLVLLATLIVSTARLPGPIGVLMGLYGITNFWYGWIVANEGFYPPALGIAVMSAPLINIVMIVWLMIVAWRKNVSLQAARA